MVLYQLIIHFDELKSTGLEILVKSVGAINNYKYESWSQLISPISPNRLILAHKNVLLADIKPHTNISMLDPLLISEVPFLQFYP